MIIEKILQLIFNTASEWHNKGLTVFDLPENEETVENAAIRVLYHNYQTWHLIDLYKSNPSKVPYDNHGITHNKLRNYAISDLDEYLNKYQKGTGKMHSETLGDIIDKISILFLKTLHIDKEDLRFEVATYHLNILVSCAKDLFDEMIKGDRQCPVLRRFKV